MPYYFTGGAPWPAPTHLHTEGVDELSCKKTETQSLALLPALVVVAPGQVSVACSNILVGLQGCQIWHFWLCF